MIRVGFILSYTDSNWVGGINYLSNLLHAIAKVPDRKIEPVLIVSPSISAHILEAFPPWQTLRTALVDGQHRRWSLARKLCERLWGRDFLMERFLKQHRIHMLSHSGHLGRRAKVPTIGWLADFQHCRMPECFQPAEIAARNRGYRRISTQCTTVLLSSIDAQHDLAQFDIGALSSSRVLHFVSGFSSHVSPMIDEDVLRSRYNIVGPYFHLPNQFWIHKNHRVVIDALTVLKARGKSATVLCTGYTKDRRWTEYFDELMRHARDKSVSDCFIVLGLVPYEDMACLMMHSVGVINPSLFEGWSTTVEEAKSLGLTIILSDIAVHREQDPERGIFFNPNNAEELADTLSKVLENYTAVREYGFQKAAKSHMPSRFLAFGVGYQNIALDTFSRKRAV